MEDADIGIETNAADREHARMPFELRALEVALDVVSPLILCTLCMFQQDGTCDILRVACSFPWHQP